MFPLPDKILFSTSLSYPSCVLMVPPRYTKFSVCSSSSPFTSGTGTENFVYLGGNISMLRIKIFKFQGQTIIINRQRLRKLLARFRRWGYLPYDFPSVTPWLMRLIESCSDLSPNVSLMSCITFSKGSQPRTFP